MKRVLLALIVFGVLAVARPASAQQLGTPRELEHVGVTEHLDQKLPLATPFRDHTGKEVRLGDFFDTKRPVVLQFAYHSCPVVCGLITNNLADGLRQIDWTLGDQYQVVTISIDPHESLEKTAAKRSSILTEYGRPGAQERGGWHFLVGDEKSIATVAEAAGFSFQYDAEQKQWAHPSLAMVVTPDGHMARYLYGFDFAPNDLRLALLEASQGRSMSTVEQIILYCYHYDPQGGKYVLVARRVMQVGAGAIAFLLFSILAAFWLREFKRGRKRAEAPAT